MNRSERNKTHPPNPLNSASFLSKLTFWWLKPIFVSGLKRGIEEDDICTVLDGMKSDQTTEAYSIRWQQELKTNKPSIFHIILKESGLKVLIYVILYAICESTSRIVQPICLSGLISYFSQQNGNLDITRADAYWYASGIVLTSLFCIVTFHPYMLLLTRESIKVRVACGGLIYKKSLRLLKSSSNDGQSGKVVNLLSSDLTKLEFGILFLHWTLIGPIESIGFLIVLYQQIGKSAVIGSVFLASFIPFQAYLSKKVAQYRVKNAQRTDFRVKIMNEILLGIQVIKMYAWEKSFAKMVDQIRKSEVDAIRSMINIRATIISIIMVPKISVFLSLISYVYFGNVITASKVFMVTSYFNVLETSMIYLWPISLASSAEAFISIKRLQEFLLSPESKESHQLQNDTLKKDTNKTSGDDIKLAHTQQINSTTNKRIQNITSFEKFIRFKNVTAAWQQNGGIFEFSTMMKSGLTAIVGAVGSGKSTLLNVILGELEIDAGKLTINGSISYASQEPWIFGGSVRNNIVFVEKFDEKRYKKVVEVCALERDFELLPHGDETVVGEQGSSLSGGQKARVNLARAIYKQSDIYLLDDPLSAVDAHVGKHIFELCVKEFLADKICVLVTHQIQYLNNVNNIILMKNGKIEAEGPFNSIQVLAKEALMYGQEDNEQSTAESTIKPFKRQSTITSECDDIIDDPNDRKEQQTKGSIKLDTYKAIFGAIQSTAFFASVCLMFIIVQVALSGNEIFLSTWSGWEESIPQGDTFAKDVSQRRNEFILIYTCIIALGIIACMCRSFGFFRMFLRISINLHDMMFRSVSRAKMTFFNTNPSGRVLNRFARDINNVDTLLPQVIFDVTYLSMTYLAIIIINIVVNPWMAIPSVIMSIIFYYLRVIFVAAGRSLKRIEALSRSPIFSHVNATLQGSATIRAFNAGEILEKELHEYQDFNSSTLYLFHCASRWFQLSLDIICCLFIAFVTFSFLLLEDSMNLDSGKVGLAILNSINLVGMCRYGMSQTAELENQMTSAERVIEYTKLPSEPPLESDEKNAPTSDWPQHGNIEFKSLSMRYAENSPRILRNLTFRVNAKEKIGVVGRTGAGKSSIIQSLFRLAQNEGQILIDGVDIGVIGLHDLRKKISIIPQEAVLFSGSLRYNLDPFDEKSDSDLWDSLEQVEMKTAVSSMTGGLDSKVQDGGSNFSAGQRQMLCLARAILRNNKILILDEATANVDSETDRLIQDTIRRKFANCTVITIAHRLHTVMDSDRVLVLDAGQIMEFDHPYELIQKPGGFFKRLLDQTGSATVTALTTIAKESYERCKKSQ